MSKKFRIATAGVLAASLLVLAGCAGTERATESEDPEVWGYVASEKSAQLEMAEDQNGADELVVDRVLVPEDAWIVVHADDNGKPGERIGLLPIDKGESTDVKVKLDKTPTANVIVAIHADRGADDEFDFDMMAKEMSPDRPFFVDEKELAAVVTVREFGVKVGEGEASIQVADQVGATTTLTVDSAVAPTGAWVVVHLDNEGAPGERVGLKYVEAGTNTGISVDLYPIPLTDQLFVAVHADRGEPNLFEFDMMDKVNSPDQPFFIGEEEVATAVKVR